MEAFLKSAGKQYLHDTLTGPINEIISTDTDFEVDPSKVHSTLLQQQQRALRNAVQNIWHRIAESHENFPPQLRECLATFKERLIVLNREDMADNVISASIFLRFLCPAIRSPNLFNIQNEVSTPRSTRNLTLVANTLQTLAKFTRFQGNEDFMGFLNDFLEKEAPRMKVFLHQISTRLNQQRQSELAVFHDILDEMATLKMSNNLIRSLENRLEGIDPNVISEPLRNYERGIMRGALEPNSLDTSPSVNQNDKKSAVIQSHRGIYSIQHAGSMPSTSSISNAVYHASSLEQPLDELENESSIADPTKIDNLHSFPTEVLEKIFMRTNDIDLLNLSNTCLRFEAITKTVFAERYADACFKIEGKCDPDIYKAFFEKFSGSINAIEAFRVAKINADHWLTQLLQPHINQIVKLKFKVCSFESIDVLTQSIDHVTHLTFERIFMATEEDFDLPDFSKLKTLEFIKVHCVSIGSIKRAIRNNRELRSISFNNTHGISLLQIITYIADHLKDLRELRLTWLDDKDSWNIPESDAIDTMVSSFQHLELLELHVHSNTLGLLQRLGKGCKRIKQLYLEYHGTDAILTRSILEAVGLFQQVDEINLSINTLDDLQFIECLSNLRKLHVIWYMLYDISENLPSALLSLLRSCPSLEEIKIKRGLRIYSKERNFLAAEFYNEFMDIIRPRRPNARVQMGCDEISRKGILLRGKLMIWAGCDQNDTDINVLDLAKEPDKSNEKRDATQPINVLDRIFNYLDVDSLNSFAETNSQSKQLVENYIKMHSERNGTFTVTDEFESYENTDNSHHMFAPYVTDLKVHADRRSFYSQIGNYKQLTKLSIVNRNGYHYRFELPELPKPVAHVVFDQQFCDYDFSGLRKTFENNKCTETLELKCAGDFGDCFIFHERLEFGNLKKLIFNYRGDKQLNNLIKIFKHANVEFVPIISKA